MKLPLDVMYCQPDEIYTRYDYPSKICKTHTDAYERERERLQLANKLQKDYYDCRISGFRIVPTNLVLLWSPNVDKKCSAQVSRAVNWAILSNQKAV